MLDADLQQAIHTVQQGGVLAYPTEAVYGLGCNPQNLAAVQRILDLKQRPAKKGLILIAADWTQLSKWLLPLSAEVQARVTADYAYPITWLLPTADHVSTLIRGEHDSLAVRVTQHPTCRLLCQALGYPLISTSANRSYDAPARSAQQVRAYFADTLDYILDASLGTASQPSEIRDGLSNQLIRPA
jgi:L-threonylcarbamoyladenylate synthase